MVFLKDSFSRRYSNLKFEKFDSAQANTSRSRNFSTSQPFKKLTKNVGLCCNSSYIYFVLFNILFQSKERPAQTKLLPAKLRAVLDTFGFSENLIIDYAQCQPAWSPTPRSVSQFWIFRKFSQNISKIRHMDPRFPGNGGFRKLKKF